MAPKQPAPSFRRYTQEPTEPVILAEEQKQTKLPQVAQGWAAREPFSEEEGVLEIEA